METEHGQEQKLEEMLSASLEAFFVCYMKFPDEVPLKKIQNRKKPVLTVLYSQ